jgi:hypothetical protein
MMNMIFHPCTEHHILHRLPCKQRYIVGAAKCSTTPLSKLLASILKRIPKRQAATMDNQDEEK